MDTFTARLTRPGKQPRFIPNATIHKGFVVSIIRKGIGEGKEVGGWTAGGDGDVWTEYDQYIEVRQPYYDGAQANMESIRATLKRCTSVEDVIAAGLERCLLMFGNQSGYEIVNIDAEAEEKERLHQQAIADKKIPIEITAGHFGLKLSERLPAADWAKVKHLATYHDGGEGDMEWLDDQDVFDVPSYEARGWFFHKEIVELLTTMGYTVEFNNTRVTNTEELEQASIEKKYQENTHYKRVKDIQAKAHDFKKTIWALADDAGPCSKEDADFAATLPRIKLLNMQGANIYGCGSWLHVFGEDLFFVQNNGADGDDWSRNNYDTGGAGAICYKISGKAGIVIEIKAWVDSQGDYAVYATP